MATHDYVIANASGAAVRADLNNALAAIVTNNSNATEPATTYPYMLWADTTAGQLKLRNGTNDTWIVLQELDGTLLMEDGTVAAPGLAFASDIDTGFYRPGADQVAVSTNGVQRVRYGTTAVIFNDAAEDYDFRIKGSTQPSLIATNAGDDTISFGGNITSDTVYDGDVRMASQNGGQLAGFRNKIINGDFQVWQRGTTGTGPSDPTLPAYVSADRWKVGGGSTTLAQATTVPDGSIRAATVSRASGVRSIRQGIELSGDPETEYPVGSVWTISYKSTQSMDDVIANFGSGLTDSDSLGGIPVGSITTHETVDGYTRYSATATINATNAAAILIRIRFNASVDFSITDVQFEPGNVATPFERRPYGTEFALCERYFQKYDSVPFIGLPMNGRGTGSNTIDALYPLRVPMRAAPTGTYTGQLEGFRATRVDTGTNITPTAVAVSGITSEPYQYVKIVGTVSSIPAGQACVMTSTGSGNDFAFEVDAEL